MDAFELDLGRGIHEHEVSFLLFPRLWEEFSLDGLDLNRVTWHEYKFLNNDGTAINDDINNLPSNHGGIYLFCVKPNICTEFPDYLMYIGRAKSTASQNLRKRCRSYFGEYNAVDGRPKIQRLIRLWGKYLYVKYTELDDNEIIVDLEAKLINALLPPFNDEIPDRRIRRAVGAFE